MNNKPDLYLDVDGVMLVVPEIIEGDQWQQENLFLFEWVKHSRHRFNKIYWLTCWGVKRLYERYPRFQELDAIEANWQIEKTTGIDWSRPFIWIEDGVLDSEREVFRHISKPGQQIWELRQSQYPFNGLGQR